MLVALKELDGVEGKVGWFPTAVHPNGTPVALAAAASEFGVPSRSIPPRPFFRPTIAEKNTSWVKLASALAGKMVEGITTARDAMELLCLQATSDVKDTIENVRSPKLSDITLVLRKWRREGRKISGATVGEAARALKNKTVDISGVPSDPLNDTGLMIRTLDSVVVQI